MSLTKLRTVNVKGLKDGEYRLKPITYVCGGNRSGKSAILQAIQYAVFGRCDEMGAKGMGALVRTGTSACEIQCEGDQLGFEARVFFNAKGSVSQDRHCLVDGKEVTERELQKYLGDVPCSLSQFRDLTGEEVWRLIMPIDSADSSAGMPENIKATAGELMKKLTEAGFSVSGIAAQLAGEMDCFSRATALLEAVNASLREVREKARALLLAVESAPEPYVGPSLSELRAEEKLLKSQVQSFTEAIRSKASVEQTTEYNNSRIASLTAEVQALEAAILRMQGLIANREALVDEGNELLARMPNFVNSGDFSGLGYYSEQVSELLESIRDLDPHHAILKMADSLGESLKEYIDHNSYHVGDDIYLDSLIQSVMSKSKALMFLEVVPTKSSVKNMLFACLKEIDNHRATLQKTAENLRQKKDSIAALRAENENLRSKLEEAVDDAKMEAVSMRLEQVMHTIMLASEYAKYVSQAQDARNASTKLKSLEPNFDQLVEELQAFRVSAMNDGIGRVCEIANQVITYCDLSPVVIEPVVGKRPSLVIRNEAGSMYSAMSGAERLIYGSAIILAIQSVRNVVNSLLFLEGGELDVAYTTKFLLATTKVVKNGNIFLAHWLNHQISDPAIGVINV